MVVIGFRAIFPGAVLVKESHRVNHTRRIDALELRGIELQVDHGGVRCFASDGHGGEAPGFTGRADGGHDTGNVVWSPGVVVVEVGDVAALCRLDGNIARYSSSRAVVLWEVQHPQPGMRLWSQLRVMVTHHYDLQVLPGLLEGRAQGSS